MSRATSKAGSPTIDGFLSRWKGDERFRALLPPVDGITADRAVEEKRSFALMDWVVREFTPIWLGVVSPRYRDRADTFRRLPRIDTWEGLVRSLTPLIQVARLASQDMSRLYSETSSSWSPSWMWK